VRPADELGGEERKSGTCPEQLLRVGVEGERMARLYGLGVGGLELARTCLRRVSGLSAGRRRMQEPPQAGALHGLFTAGWPATERGRGCERVGVAAEPIAPGGELP